jgi:hypothetical protein
MCCPKDSAGADCSGGLPSNQIECVYVHGPVAPSSDVDISQRKKEKKGTEEERWVPTQKTSIKIRLARAKTGRPFAFYSFHSVRVEKRSQRR